MSCTAQRKRARARFLAAHPFCAKCGAPGSIGNPLTIDHIIPRSRGGTNAQKNWQVLCFRCNVRKGSKVSDRALQLWREYRIVSA
jgi:5-methylcytosine-specific restriction protein A